MEACAAAVISPKRCAWEPAQFSSDAPTLTALPREDIPVSFAPSTSCAPTSSALSACSVARPQRTSIAPTSIFRPRGPAHDLGLAGRFLPLTNDSSTEEHDGRAV